MSDMVDSGRYAFEAWARQTPSPAHGICFYDRWLGTFNPEMPAEEACARLLEGKLTPSAEAAFMRGWNQAQAQYRTTPQRPTGHKEST